VATFLLRECIPTEIAGNLFLLFGSYCPQLQRSWPDVGQEFMHLRFVRLLAIYFLSAKRETIDIVHASRVIFLCKHRAIRPR
jgi:hypothetical protein